ncbi:MAG: BMP family ABC transporter substrate-binding protein [Oscillospiraceae bacterium]|nr:BMP family ABC transporter substrate-binding protein [Oscillospiraceae bacterium]
MKKLIALLLVLVLVAGLAACGGGSGGGGGGGGAGSGDGLSIAHIVTGHLGDLGLVDIVQSAIYDFIGQHGGSVIAMEMQHDSTLFEPTIMDAARSGDFDVIITGFFTLREPTSTAAAAFPDQKFIVYDTYIPGHPANVRSALSRQSEGAFLAGAMAAMMTTYTALEGINEERVIGFVGGVENTAIQDFFTGYIEGAKYINPDTRVLLSFIGSFTDAALGKELALAQYAQGADIIFAVAGAAGMGIAEAAPEAGRYVIGVDICMVQQLGLHNPAAHRVLGTPQKALGVLVYQMLNEIQDGSIQWGTHSIAGLADGGITWIDNEHYRALVPQWVWDELEIISEKIISGEIVVSTAIGADQAFIDSMHELAASGSGR